jgi:hypothetical protein
MTLQLLNSLMTGEYTSLVSSEMSLDESQIIFTLFFTLPC